MSEFDDIYPGNAFPPAPPQQPKPLSLSHWQWRLGQKVVARVPALRRGLPLYSRIASAYDGAELTGFTETVDMPEPELCRRFTSQSTFPLEPMVVRRANLLTLRHKTVLGSTGRIVDEKAQTVLRFMGERDHVDRNDFQIRRLRPVEMRDGMYFNFLGSDRGHEHLYHFMFERLRSLYYLLERLDRPYTDLNVLIRPRLPEFQRKVIEAIGRDYSSLRFVPVPANERWRIGALVHADVAQNALPAFAAPDFLDFIRRTYMRAYDVSPRPQARRRLFISREDTRLRRFANPDPVHEVLARRGFETVLAARLSFREQIETFRDAAVIAGTHGAGLSNLVFAPAGAPLIELFPSNKMKPTYLQLSLAQGRPYHWLRGGPGGRRQTFRLDPEELDRMLTAILPDPPDSG